MGESELLRLADVVVNTIRPGKRYREDCHQAALLAGWQALANKSWDKAVSRRYLYLCMSTAVWRCWRREQKHEGNVEIMSDLPTYDAEPQVMPLLDDPRLTDEERRYLRLHYVDGLTIRQIGTKSKTPKSTVHYRLRQAISKLKETLE